MAGLARRRQRSLERLAPITEANAIVWTDHFLIGGSPARNQARRLLDNVAAGARKGKKEENKTFHVMASVAKQSSGATGLPRRSRGLVAAVTPPSSHRPC